MPPFLGPHQGQIIQSTGRPLAQAKAAMILVHGRGANAPSILTLADEFDQPEFAYLAPQAAGNTWYPYSFLEELHNNQPGLDSALQAIADVLDDVQKGGIPPEKTIIGGFSQGACLAMEFIARHARRYGGAFAFSGGLIGPLGMARQYAGSLAGTPIFLGCSNIDFHIPEERVHETAEVLTQMGAAVETRIYPQMGHTVIYEEIEFVQQMMRTLVQETT
ncbi:MAG: dienelactone hydrolase family protein [Chloroflexi bacterium]|nr:dienelactone hydrolase family protein [Chloroflexota bacterium]